MVVFKFFKLQEWYKIEQSISYGKYGKRKKFFRVNLFPATILNLQPLKTPENQRFSGVFLGGRA